MTTPASSILLVLALCACAGDDSSDSRALDAAPPELEAETPPEPDAAYAGCTRGTLEDDLERSPLMGAAVTNGELPPGDYIVSTTYLQIKPEKNARLDELLGPVMADLATRDGLVALAFGNSPTCNTARTLAVWRDETAMLEFVVDDAHATAMAAAPELNRGGSSTSHWTGTERTVNWNMAAARLANEKPVRY